MEKEIKFKVGTIEKKDGEYGPYILLNNAEFSMQVPYSKIACGNKKFIPLFEEDTEYVLLGEDSIKNGFPNFKIKTIIAKNGIPIDLPQVNRPSKSKSPEEQKKIMKQSTLDYATKTLETYFSCVNQEPIHMSLTDFARMTMDISDLYYEHVNEE